MPPTNNNLNTRSKGYFKYLMFILILVQILDSYASFYNTVIASKVVEELLTNYSENLANSIYAICIAIASLGAYLAFVMWYSADRIGRKFLLVVTVFGTAIASIGILFSTNIIEYTIFLFLLNIFAASDIWLIYVNEESPPEKKAFWTSIVLIGGIIGAVLMPLFRSVFITETSPIGAWRGMTYFAIALGIPLGILIVLSIKETSKYKEIKERGPIAKEKINKLKENLKIIFKSERRKPYFVLLLLSFIWGLNGIYLSLGELFIASSPYLSEVEINIIITIMSLAIIIGYLITAFIADRIGRKPLLCIYGSLFFIGAIFVVVGAQTPGAALLIVCIGTSIMNISFWGLWILISIVAIEILPTDTRGTGIGLKNIIKALGLTVGLFLAGVIIYFLSLGIAFLIFGALLLLSVPLIYKYILETRGTDLSAIT